MEPQAILEGSVEGRHDGAPDVGVRQAQGVAQLVGGRHQQVGPALEVVSPALVVVKVNVATVDWEECVSQSSSWRRNRKYNYDQSKITIK